MMTICGDQMLWPSYCEACLSLFSGSFPLVVNDQSLFDQTRERFHVYDLRVGSFCVYSPPQSSPHVRNEDLSEKRGKQCQKLVEIHRGRRGWWWRIEGILEWNVREMSQIARYDPTGERGWHVRLKWVQKQDRPSVGEFFSFYRPERNVIIL